MNIDINNNITSGVLSLIYQDNIDKNTTLNLLNISCDVSKAYTELKQQYPNSNIYNIEIDEFYKENLSKIENTTFIDVRNFELNFESSFFDYVLLDDTLQKFANPDKVLECIKNLLKQTGHIIMSIPNFTYVNSLFSCINGNFSYSDNGPLNKSNLRFFTLNSIRNLVDSVGLDLLSITSVAIEPSPDLNKIIDALCNISGPNLRDEFYSYQYLLKSNIKSIKTLFDYVYE